MTPTKRSGPHRQERAAANALVSPDDTAWPAVKQLGTAGVDYIVRLRQASFCVLCDGWRPGRHPEHLVPEDRVVEALVERQRRLDSDRAVRDQLAERRGHGLRARHAAKLRR